MRAAFTQTRTVDNIESREGKAERQLSSFNKFLWDDKQYLAALQAIAAVVESAAEGNITRDFGRNREQTEALLDRVLAEVELS